MLEEDSVLGGGENEEEEEEEEDKKSSRNRLLVELELLVSKIRQMLSDMIKTGGKVLLTVLLGITGRTSSTST